MTDMKKEIKSELINHILPFWSGLADKEHGGFYSNMGNDLILDKTGDKGCILNSRILWLFSNSYIALKDESLLSLAVHSYNFLKEYFYDRKRGGVFWSVDYMGNPKDTIKHSYNIAFAIYALSSFHEASGNREALALSVELMELLENTFRDENGYKEALSVDYAPQKNEHLSENGVNAEKTMNTLLHIFEAYTQLYKVCPLDRVKESMLFILDIFENKIYNPKRHRLEVFFDEKMNSLIDLHSFGHDIEVAWLLEKGVKVLGDEDLQRRFAPLFADLEQEILKDAFDGESVAAESENGRILQTRIWWVQCEAIIGFYNAYTKRPSEKQYFTAVKNIWEYVKKYMIDSRPGGEWLGERAYDAARNVHTNQMIVSAWKCPYHNGRMCLEMMKRMGN